MTHRKLPIVMALVLVTLGFLVATPRVEAAPVVSYTVTRYPYLIYDAGWTWGAAGRAAITGAVSGAVGGSKGGWTGAAVGAGLGAVAGIATYAAGQAYDSASSSSSSDSSSSSSSSSSSDSSSSSSDSSSSSSSDSSSSSSDSGDSGSGPGEESDEGLPPSFRIRDDFSSGEIAQSNLSLALSGVDQWGDLGGFDGVVRILPPALEGIRGVRLWQRFSLTRFGGSAFVSPVLRTFRPTVDVRVNTSFSFVNGVPDRNILLD